MNGSKKEQNMFVLPFVKISVIFFKAELSKRVSTLDYLITQHVGLFFFKKKSALCVLIRSCWFINFREKFHPVQLLDPVRLFISENFLLCCYLL